VGQPTDAELWRLAADGDAAAFGVLFERHARAVYNFCFRRTADWAVAEDLTSIVFLEAWRRRGEVRLKDGRALPWLLGVATNVLRNRRRSERRHRAALERLTLEHSPDFADDADARLDDERRMRVALRSVSKLPQREREVIALCAWAGLSYEDAAVALGLPVGTVRSRLSRARARLRELGEASGHESDGDHAVRAHEAYEYE
jgi:RNA polymerase sigma factor (sigma-70 family)